MSFTKIILKAFRLYIFIFLFLISFNFVACDDCFKVTNLQNKTCFNDVITFNHDKWRAGHACNDRDENLIVEFSLDKNSSRRLFYGLNKNGRYYFPDEPVYKELDLTCQDCPDDILQGRFESRNILVSIDGDSTNKQYLFSVSTFHSLVELINFESNNFNYYSWYMENFFVLNRPIFPYEYSLFEIGNTKTYILAFIESAGYMYNDEIKKDEEYSNTTTLTKFKLKNFDTTNYKEIIKSETLENTYNGRVVSAFRLDISQLIVLIFVEPVKVDKNEQTGNYKAYFYNDNLEKLGECMIHGSAKKLWIGYGLFVKGISVKDDYAALALFPDGDSRTSLAFKFIKYKGGNEYDFEYKLEHYFTSNSFRQDVQSNGLYKLTDDRIVLFTTEDYGGIDYGQLNMFLIDFYDNYNKAKIRRFKFDYPEKRFAKEMDASM